MTNMSVHFSFNSSVTFSDLLSYCLESRLSIFSFTAFSVTNIFLLPVFFVVLYTGYQRWRRQRSGSLAAVTSHLDVFTYNVITLELVSLLGCFCFCYGALMKNPSATRVAMHIFSFTSPGQTMFHALTCVERYLAVVHPVTYLGLRQAGGLGLRIRNISVGCVWLLCFSALGLTRLLDNSSMIIMQSCLLVFFLIVVSFCSLSVLCILIRPGPREAGGNRLHVDQSKQRAFQTITVITGVLWLRFVGILIGGFRYNSALAHTTCVVLSTAAWFTLPGSLVLPLLFLHRAGKLAVCKHAESG